MTYPQKYYFLSLFVMGDFTLGLLKNIGKMILRKLFFFYVARGPKRENK